MRRKKHFTPEQLAIRKKENWASWYSRNKIQQREKARKYAAANGERLKAARRKSEAARKKVDVEYKISCNLRRRLYSALWGKSRTGSAVRDLGCSIEEFRAYLEERFHPRRDGTAMSWENYGRSGWHIDHIDSFLGLRGDLDVRRICHYTNLQPLWYEANLEKRDRERALKSEMDRLALRIFSEGVVEAPLPAETQT
jgi:hypothetical protein